MVPWKKNKNYKVEVQVSQSCLAVRFPEVQNRKGTEGGLLTTQKWICNLTGIFEIALKDYGNEAVVVFHLKLALSRLSDNFTV